MGVCWVVRSMLPEREFFAMDYENYFRYRRVDAADYRDFRVPPFLVKFLGRDQGAAILDFGCGFGQLAEALVRLGFTRVEGLDVAPAAMAHCRSVGLLCHDGRDPAFYESHQARYDYVVLSHVVEHFPKDEIIPLLARVRGLLRPTGAAVVIVPNAQSHTGAYWAYEDFTHYTLFTAGSLFYVLMAAGFNDVQMLDPDSLEGLALWKRLPKAVLLGAYKLNYRFWNRVTSSVVHGPSPSVFGFEVRAVARG